MPKPKPIQRTKVTRQRRPRRSTEEIIDRLLEAAGEEFERKGYDGAKTAAIARKAGVAEFLIFNHFGSKAKLFQDSIFKPLNRQFIQFCSTHMQDAANVETLRKSSREYILELKRFIEQHSGMLMSLATAQMYTGEDVQGLSRIEGLNEYFSQAAEMAKIRQTQKTMIDVNLMGRVSFATILSCVIFKDWLFPEGFASADQVNAAISNFIIDGFRVLPDPKTETLRAVRSPISPKTSRSSKRR